MLGISTGWATTMYNLYNSMVKYIHLQLELDTPRRPNWFVSKSWLLEASRPLDLSLCLGTN